MKHIQKGVQGFVPIKINTDYAIKQLRSGVHMNTLSKELGVTRKTLRKKVVEVGYHPKSDTVRHKKIRDKHKRRQMEKFRKEQVPIVLQLLGEGKNLLEIASQLETSASSLSEKMQDSGYPVREFCKKFATVLWEMQATKISILVGLEVNPNQTCVEQVREYYRECRLTFDDTREGRRKSRNFIENRVRALHQMGMTPKHIASLLEIPTNSIYYWINK